MAGTFKTFILILSVFGTMKAQAYGGTSFTFTLFKDTYSLTVNQWIDKPLQEVVKIYADESTGKNIFSSITNISINRLDTNSYEVHTTAKKFGFSKTVVTHCSIETTSTSWRRTCSFETDKKDTATIAQSGTTITLCQSENSRPNAPRTSCTTASVGVPETIDYFIYYRSNQRVALAGAFECLRYLAVLWRMAEFNENVWTAKSNHLNTVISGFINRLYTENIDDAQDNRFNVFKLKVSASDIQNTYQD